MSYNLEYTEEFLKSTKKLTKKYPSFKSDLQAINDALLENPRMGTLITENVRKVRFAIKSKNKGKSGGARMITYLTLTVDGEKEAGRLFLMTVYDKSATSTIANKELKDMVDSVKKLLEEE
ncbi:MAG: hypothetical protein AAFN92_06315 [Bacteroidota bacterium]